MGGNVSDSKTRFTITLPAEDLQFINNLASEVEKDCNIKVALSNIINVMIGSWIARYKAGIVNYDDLKQLIIGVKDNKSNDSSIVFVPDKAFSLQDLIGKSVAMQITETGYIVMIPEE